MGVRHRSREAAVKILYQADLRREEDVDRLIKESGEDEEFRGEIAPDFVEKLVHGVTSRLRELDTRLAGISKSWPPERLGYLERAILRLALYEMFYEDATPDKVVIDEAVELAKAYCDAESAGFVNGVLDMALKEKTGGGL